MGKWVLQTQDKLLPEWLQKNLSSKCELCGHEMENYYNDDDRCTFRRCSNPNCVGMKASKGAFMFKLLGYKGIGYAKCRDWSYTGRFKSHVEFLSLAGAKPTMHLYEYLRIHCFKGVDGEWEVICKKLGIYTLDELYEKYDGKHNELLRENKELLYENLKHVNLVERPKDHSQNGPARYLTIMITGTPNGYDSKDAFIDSLNALMKGRIIIIHQKTKKMSGVDYLIREPGSTTRGKLDAAIRGGIPIVTSVEFIEECAKLVEKINSEN